MKALYKDYADIADMRLANNAQPKLAVAFTSALQSVFDRPFDVVAMPGALGDTRLYSVSAAQNDVPEALTRILRSILKRFSDAEFRNFLRLRMDAEHQNARLSRRGELHWAPPGTEHNFPIAAPDFTLDEVRKMVAWVKAETQGATG